MNFVQQNSFLILHILSSSINGFYNEKSMKSILSSTYTSLPNNSYFGYSVTYQPLMRSLLISAPSADWEGKVFSYDIDRNNLTEVDIHLKTDDNATDSWLGATIKAGDSFYTTCAPRRVVKHVQTGTFGKCFIKSITDDKEIRGLRPMKDSDRIIGVTKREHATDTFGWSIDVTAHSNILIGGPAMLKGRVIQYNDTFDVPHLILPPNAGDSNRKLDYFNFVHRLEISDGIETRYSTALNLLLGVRKRGYSIASGNFLSDDPNNISYAISTPYGDSGIGQVLFYTENGQYIDLVIDKESRLGSLFGAVLCTVRLSNGRSSLLVGAPAYVPEDSHDTDVGAVHIYTPDEKLLSLRKIIRGHSSGGRFGNAIVNVGDLDSDHGDDVAIAAPYEDDGKGAVYIYTANNLLADKMDISYSQRIQAETLQTFGLSLAVLKDYDDNGCNELAIGAPESNAVAVFSCFSSIDLNVFTKIPNLQDRGNTDRNKFTFKTCLNFSYPEKPENVIADVLINVSIMHPTAKLMASRNATSSYKITLDKKKSMYCDDIVVLTPLDKYVELYPIQITTNAQLEDDPRQSNIFNPQRVILSERSTLSTFDTVWVSGCNFTFCSPNISTKISSIASPYIIGSSDTEDLHLNVTNSGETAYNACLRIHIGSARALHASHCRRDEGTSLICEPGSPMRFNQSWNNIKISLETKFLTSKDKNIKITIDTYNHCGNETDKKTDEVNIDLKPDITNLVLMSEAVPGDVVNITSVALETEINHLFTIINNGITKWVDVISEISLENQYAQIVNPILIYKDNQNSFCNINLNARVANGTVVSCHISEIRKNQKIFIMVKLRIPPIPRDEFDTDKNYTILTRLRLLQDGEIKTISANSTLVMIAIPSVSFWIYAGAGFVALLVLIVLVVILHECGCLKRKNKELLEDLKQNVKRQSMRRTIQLRESIRASQNQTAKDENKLLDLKTTDKEGCENSGQQ